MSNSEDQRETDSVDLFTAFAIGAMIGVGATLLLRPDPPTQTERIMERFAPLANRAQKAARRAGREYSRGVKRTRTATRELGESGMELLDDLRSEVEEILSSARDELSDTARRQLKSARKTLGRKLRG